jgi:uncharacterized protein YggE
MSDPDLLYINVDEEFQSDAKACDLYLQVRGSSFWSANEALKKAKEVSGLVNELSGIGVANSEIEILEVTARKEKGLVSSSSSADYSLKVKCTDFSKFPPILGVVTRQKNISLQYMDWDYGNDEDAQTRAIERALAKAKRKAKIVADALGVSIQGVHTFTDEVFHSGPLSSKAAVSHLAQVNVDYCMHEVSDFENLAPTIRQTRNSILKVKVKFRISGFSGAKGDA